MFPIPRSTLGQVQRENDVESYAIISYFDYESIAKDQC
jgi:hypothetical protein